LRRIIETLKTLLLEKRYCPHCKDYVRVKITKTKVGRKVIEEQTCIKCGKVIEKIVKIEEKN